VSGRPSTAGVNAMVGTLISQGKFKEFLRQYRQKYYTSLDQAVFDPGMSSIFSLLKATVESNYTTRSGNNLLDIETDAVVFAIVPYEFSSTDNNDSSDLDAYGQTKNWDRLELKCYILSDPRSRVASPSVDIILQAFQNEQRTGTPSETLRLLPTFSYDMSHQTGVQPIVGDIVKVKSDSSAYMTGVCTAVTKANIAYMLAAATEQQYHMSDALTAMDTKLSTNIGGIAECADNNAPRYNPQSMSISPQGKKFISAHEGYRGWIYDDKPGTNDNSADWMGPSAIGGTPSTRWKWADYYIPRSTALTPDWYTVYRPGWPWGTKTVPSIGDGHAIKVRDPNPSRGSLLGDEVNEREIYDRNFKQDLQGMPSRNERQQNSRGNWASKKARIGYNPNEDPAPVSRARAEELRDVDIEAHCAYFKSKINVPITQNQFDALASICINKGPNFYGLRELIKELNKGNCDEAAKWFMKSDTELVSQGTSAGHVSRRTKEAKLFAGHGYTGAQGLDVFAQVLTDHRQAAAETFVESKGKYKKWVGKSGWFDQQLQDSDNPVVQVATVAQNMPVANRTPCSYLYPDPVPGSDTVVYGSPPGCDDQTG